jgi:hypothetical protein
MLIFPSSLFYQDQQSFFPSSCLVKPDDFLLIARKAEEGFEWQLIRWRK